MYMVYSSSVDLIGLPRTSLVIVQNEDFVKTGVVQDGYEKQKSAATHIHVHLSCGRLEDCLNCLI